MEELEKRHYSVSRRLNGTRKNDKTCLYGGKETMKDGPKE